MARRGKHRVRAALALVSMLCVAPPHASAQPPSETREAAAETAGAKAAARARSRQARAELERGRAAYRKGDLEAASQHLRKARELSDESPELAFDLARVHDRMGDVQTARLLYVELLASAHAGPKQRREVQERLAALDVLEQRQREQLMLPPPSESALSEEARVLFQHGLDAFRAGRYEAAHAAFTASQSAVRLPEHAYNLALTCERLGRARDAIDHYREYARHADAAEADKVRARIRALQATVKGPQPRR